jgi:hypothetical protein
MSHLNPSSLRAPPAPAGGKLVVHLQYGLGNRLCAFLAGLVVADRLGAELQIVWPSNQKQCGAAIGDLFERSSLEGIDLVESVDDASREAGVESSSVTNIKEALAAKGTLHLLRAHDFFGRELFAEWEFFEKIREKVKRFRPTAPVRELIEGIPPAYFGLHARMTDHLPCLLITPRWCYRAAMSTLGSQVGNRNIYVCSDSPDFSEELVSAYPRHGVKLPALKSEYSTDRATVPSVQRALAELWKLSECKIIYASPCSSFAKIASVLGGGKFHPIFAWTRRSLGRQIAFGWGLLDRVKYAGNENWIANPNFKGRARGIQNGLALLFARAISHRLYQDCPPSIQKKTLSNRIARTVTAEVE